MKQFFKIFLQVDKLLHIFSCLAIALSVMLVLVSPRLQLSGEGGKLLVLLIPFVGGLLAAMFAGISKEIYDYLNGGYIDRLDLIADAIGAFLSIIPYILFLSI